jgi:hypothetical protein
MKTRSRLIALVAILVLGALPLFAGTRIVFRWVLTGIPMPAVKKILIVGLTDNYLVRQEFEDKLEELLAKSGVTGIKSHMVFSPKNELMEGELRQRIRESTLDAVLVVRPKEVRQESQEVVTGGFYVPPPGYYTFWPYWNLAYTSVYSSASYIKQNTVIRAECNIYNVKDEKLIWSGESDTMLEKRNGQGLRAVVVQPIEKGQSDFQKMRFASAALPACWRSCRAMPVSAA